MRRRAIYETVHLEGRPFDEVVEELLQLRMQMQTQLDGVWDHRSHKQKYHTCNNECRLRVPLLKARKRFVMGQTRVIDALDEMVRVFTSDEGGCPRGPGWHRLPDDELARNQRAAKAIAQLDKRKKMR